MLTYHLPRRPASVLVRYAIIFGDLFRSPNVIEGFNRLGGMTARMRTVLSDVGHRAFDFSQ